MALAASDGDQGAFAALVERYRSYVYAIAYKITLDEEDALDVAQTVFLRMAERLGDFEGRGSFRRWLAAIAAREAISLCRRRNRRRETATDPNTLDRLREEGGEQTTGGGSDWNGPAGAEKAPQYRTVLRAERRERVETAMAELSPQQRAVFTLRFKEDMSPAEIAERLGLSPGQARVQLCRAVARLRDLVGEE